MKEYISISRNIVRNVNTFVFDKLDGSNIRIEWDSKKFFHKFGSRTRLLGTDQEFLPESIEISKSFFEKDVSDILKKEKVQSATLFFEFFGKNSFAGNHINENHELVLFDINIYKKGILPPKEFLKLFGNLNIAKLLYTGNITKEFEEKVINSELEGMTFEGVVCKQLPLKNGYPPNMFKIKSNCWIEKLKNFCGDDINKFNQLF